MNKKACPFCGSFDLEIETGALVTSSKGIDYQSGYMECNTCGACGPVVNARDKECDELNLYITEKWNQRIS